VSGRRTLVTGAAGFIGSWVVERLLARGDRVIGLDSFDQFYDPGIKRRNLAAASGSQGFRLVEGDIRDEALWDGLLEDEAVDVIVHLAARAGVRPSIAQAPLYADVNVRGTTVLFEAARRHGVPKVVYASSSSVYGGNEKVPFAEEDPVDHPVSPYAATKKACEVVAHTYHHLYEIDAIGLRYFTVYGPRQRPEMAIHKFTRMVTAGESIPVFGDGSSRRDYTYIDDIADGTLAAIERGRGYRIYNLGESRTTTLLDLVRMVGESLGKTPKVSHVPEQPGDVPATFADVTRARTELGYDPQVDMEEGLRRFVDWYRRGSEGESER
jgi:UDP-glucuronate 4-epimerase